MFVTFGPILTVSKDVQSSKAYELIFLTPSPINAVVRAEHSANALNIDNQRFVL